MIDGYRRGKTAWLADSSVVGALSKRIERATNLNSQVMDGAENYQITKYDIGGHNGPHYDVLLDAAQGPGDRIATL